jgi:hypothetical protein
MNDLEFKRQGWLNYNKNGSHQAEICVMAQLRTIAMQAGIGTNLPIVDRFLAG